MKKIRELYLISNPFNYFLIKKSNSSPFRSSNIFFMADITKIQIKTNAKIYCDNTQILLF